MMRRRIVAVSGVLLAMVLGTAIPGLSSPAVGGGGHDRASSPVYAVDFVATAAHSVDMNDRGHVTGTSRLDNGCGSTCLPPEDTVVWRGRHRIVLPEVPGLSTIHVVDINDDDWVVGYAGVPGTITHAVVWRPVGSSYQAIDLGTLPGKPISVAAGLDDLGRVVGWSVTQGFPGDGAPFVWTEKDGMVDLTDLGFPPDQPLAISPGGTVGTADLRYRLDDPASVVSLPPTPDGFRIGTDRFSINDAGDEGRFLISTQAEHLLYLFRLHHQGRGTWQQLSNSGTGHLSIARIGSINEAEDVTATVQGAGMIALGPDGLAELIASRVSPAYGGNAITQLGPIAGDGQILAEMILGRSAGRVVRLVPVEVCASGCMQVASLQLRGSGPEYCDRGENRVVVTARVVSGDGMPVAGARVTGRFLDDYWLDEVVSATTDTKGRAKFKHLGPPCVGAVAFLVTRATKSGLTLDRTAGELTDYVIPMA